MFMQLGAVAQRPLPGAVKAFELQSCESSRTLHPHHHGLHTAGNVRQGRGGAGGGEGRGVSKGGSGGEQGDVAAGGTLPGLLLHWSLS